MLAGLFGTAVWWCVSYVRSAWSIWNSSWQHFLAAPQNTSGGVDLLAQTRYCLLRARSEVLNLLFEFPPVTERSSHISFVFPLLTESLSVRAGSIWKHSVTNRLRKDGFCSS